MTHSGSIADAFGIVAVGHTDMRQCAELKLIEAGLYKAEYVEE